MRLADLTQGVGARHPHGVRARGPRSSIRARLSRRTRICSGKSSSESADPAAGTAGASVMPARLSGRPDPLAPAPTPRQDGRHGPRPPRGHARIALRPRRRRPPCHRLLRRAPRPSRGVAAGGVRHQRPPRVVAGRGVQRRPHRRDHAGHLRVPRRPGHHRPALPWPRPARAERAGHGHRARGARRQRGDHARGLRRPLRAHPRGEPRDPGAQCRPHGPQGRRHRGDPVAQPAARRRLQVQPAGRGPRGHRRHGLDPGPGQRPGRVRPRRRRAHPVPPRTLGRHDARLRLPRRVPRRAATGARPRRDQVGGGADRRRPARAGPAATTGWQRQTGWTSTSRW